MKRVRKLRNPPELTPREQEMVALRAEGLEVRDVAEVLGIEEHDVKNVLIRARRRCADEAGKPMTWSRFLALVIVTGQIVWDGPLGKFMPYDEIP